MRLPRINFFDYFLIFIGSLLTALSLNMFLVPNRIAAGGVSGVATILHFTARLPVGLTMLVLNLPLFLAGLKFLGLSFGFRTVLATLLLSFLTDVTARFPVVTSDLILASVYGGIVMGVGLGLVLRSGATTGGSDLAARLVHRFFGDISVGQALLGIDFLVITAAGMVFNLELAMYALFSLFISSRVIDLIQEGMNYAKAAYIISVKSKEIARCILDELNRGVTVLGGRGGYTGENREILLCVISRLEVSRLKNLVHSLDPNAFVIISDVHEVLGEGFKQSHP
ncbi:MAG: hypothetical protein PWP21_945 [Thermosediminibacterales bacterium]|nr:hypothetical protein [Thermosediminibacterales bacterium]